MSVEADHVLIVGSGFAGLAMGIRLKQAGIHDFTILEAASSLGGTWRDNHYPGAACDIQSHVYSFSFEPWPKWSRMYAAHDEILAYMEHCADKYGLRPHFRFDSEIVSAAYDDASGTWEVVTRAGKKHRGRVLVSGGGPLNKPHYPDIPGCESFAGHTFHSSKWDHSIPLEGKRVGVIGTGASAIQIVPAIGSKVAHLTVFQRTAPWIMPKPDREITAIEHRVFERVPAAQKLARTALYWMLEWRAFAFVNEPRLLKRAQVLAIRYLKSRVKDRALRAKLTPNYTMGCKRILMSNDYFEALQRPNAALVSEGIREIRPRGVVTKDGVEHELDALVFATGFYAAENIIPFAVRGRGGADLNEAWKGGAEAYLGSAIAGFPNFFLIVGPNTGLGHNSMIFMIESQVQYILDAVRTMRAEKLKAVEVLAEAQRGYNQRIQDRMAKTVWSTGGCVSWYQTKDGKNTTLWPGYTFEFRMRTRKFDAKRYATTRKERAVEASTTNGHARVAVRAGAEPSEAAG
jgi:cation diffusion facilitator CzcD-associated flavoprotein CzcO